MLIVAPALPRRIVLLPILLSSLCTYSCGSAEGDESCSPVPAPVAPSFCGATLSRTVEVDERFLGQTEQAVSFALQSWVDATAGHLVLNRSPAAKHEELLADTTPSQNVSIVHLSTTEDPEVVAHLDSEANAGGPNVIVVKGYSDGNRVYVVVDRLDSDALLRVVVMHEFGHNLGLAHLEESAAIMHPRWSTMDACLKADPHVTQADVNQLATVLCAAAGP